MRRKVLQDHANKVCDIFVGWRLAVADADIPRLIEVGEGEIRIDLLTARTTLDGQPVEPFGIAEELQAWLAARLDADGIPADGLSAATLVVRFRASEATTKRGSYRRDLKLACRSRLVTDERTYEGATNTDEQWSRSFAESPWFVER